MMHHIPQQQTWNQPFMLDAQMNKPYNQVNPFYYIFQPYLMNHMRAPHYQASHIVHLYKLSIYMILDAQMCSKHKNSQ